MGHYHANKLLREARDIIDAMKRHPNYKQPVPTPGETKTQFILRSIAHLISPPQEEGETQEIECIDLSSAVMAMEDELEEIWTKHQQS